MSETVRRVRIKEGAGVFIDFRFWRWPLAPFGDSGIAFDVMPESVNGYLDLRADYFGNKSPRYGNGSVFVKPDDVIEIAEAQ
jgi:hypothetical protein